MIQGALVSCYLFLKFYWSSADESVCLGFPTQVIPTYKIQSSLKFYLFDFLRAFLSVTINFTENFLTWENPLQGTENLSSNNCRLHGIVLLNNTDFQAIGCFPWWQIQSFEVLVWLMDWVYFHGNCHQNAFGEGQCLWGNVLISHWVDGGVLWSVEMFSRSKVIQEAG